MQIKIFKRFILNALSNKLFEMYCLTNDAADIGDALNKKYVVEDTGTKKYAIGNF